MAESWLLEPEDMSYAKIDLKLKIVNLINHFLKFTHRKLNIESLATDNLYRNINFGKSFEIGVGLFRFALQSA